jgi:hypothetical protein
MMLANPRFVIAKPIQMLDEFKVAVDAKRRILVQRMEGREEDAVSEFDRHESQSCY